MRFAFFDEDGRIQEAHNDDTLAALPDGAVALSVEQWGRRFDLRLQGSVLVVDPPVIPFARAKELVWNKIKAERDRRTENGGYKVGASWFHSDQKSRSQQLGLARRADRIEAAAGNLDAAMQDSAGNPIAWKTMNGSFVPMTARLAQQIAAAAEAADLANHNAAEAHKAAMEASADPAAYDFSAGWPAIFEA